MIAAQIGHPTMRVKDIHPSLSSAFSPNLYRWMKSRGHEYRDGGVADAVWRILPNSKLAEIYGTGTLFIGHAYAQYEGDTDFSGTGLMSVLCNGTKADAFCFPGGMLSLELVDGFWDEYLRIGRCAIDPEHKEHFISSERYSLVSGTPTCQWCGRLK